MNKQKRLTQEMPEVYIDVYSNMIGEVMASKQPYKILLGENGKKTRWKPSKISDGLYAPTKESYELHTKNNNTKEPHIKNQIRSEWKTVDTIVGRFMRSFSKDYKREITKDEFISLLKDAGSKNPSIMINDFMKPSKKGKDDNSYGYGLLFEERRGKYRLRPSLYDEFEKVFL
jgi:hypothetical protein